MRGADHPAWHDQGIDWQCVQVEERHRPERLRRLQCLQQPDARVAAAARAKDPAAPRKRAQRRRIEQPRYAPGRRQID
jgi:hypothetical protein